MAMLKQLEKAECGSRMPDLGLPEAGDSGFSTLRLVLPLHAVTASLCPVAGV